ncbi:MAG: hypothetical protein ABFD54_01155 [Armatimonadota bacterium]|nr:hypothetical protein [bacterium]
MAVSRIGVLLIGLCVVFTATLTGASADCPLNNLSFEEGTDGWTRYEAPNGDMLGALPVAGTVTGSSPTFTILPPSAPADGNKVCGLESHNTTANGGVCQSFNWPDGPVEIVVSQYVNFELDGFPLSNGCYVRLGLANGMNADRTDVWQWVDAGWNNTPGWSDVSLQVPGYNAYTLFIEAVQPTINSYMIPSYNDVKMSTLWDNVRWKPILQIESIQAPIVPGDELRPDTTATIKWTTSNKSTSRVEYGFDTNYPLHVDSSEKVMDHTILLENLVPSRTYHYRVISTLDGVPDAVSGDRTFTTPIGFSNINVTTEGLRNIITWTTDRPSTGQVAYGLSMSYGSTTALDQNTSTTHRAEITGLSPLTVYHFKLLATATGYNSVSSADQTFTTIAAPSTSLLNPSFEDGLNHWVQYSTSYGDIIHPIDGLVGPFPSNGTTRWSNGAFRAWDGSYFIGAQAEGTFKSGGVYQRVLWPAGTPCALCARMATYVLGSSGTTNVRIGIDPNGGINPEAGGIKWWMGSSSTNDDRWYPGGVIATAGAEGIVTLFLDISQQDSVAQRVCAIDDATFGAPIVTDVTSLKSNKHCKGFTLQNKVVTQVQPQAVIYEGLPYYRVYVQESTVPAGLAILCDCNASNLPQPGDKITVTGTLMVMQGEATLLANDWNVTPGPFDIPNAYGMSQRSIGGMTSNQPSFYASTGLCNVGSRMRLWGKVTDSVMDYYNNTITVYFDDGSGLQADPYTPLGVRATLMSNGPVEVNVGDFIAATGVLGIELVDPDYTPNSHDEFLSYILATSASTDWDVLYHASQLQ